jgi:4-hydroxy-3-polyprenylbenzoate decarboxylase
MAMKDEGVKNYAQDNEPSRGYPDLHDQIRELEEAGLLLRVDIPINKDTELHPLMRWQFRGGMEEKDRKAMLFTNVTDSKGKKYEIPVLVGAMGSSSQIFRVGIGRPLDQVMAGWAQATSHPIAPKVVENAPCHDIVIQGDELDEPGRGLDGLPVPISTPGWDNAPYLSTSGFISKDPDTGIQNLGIYRAQIKARRRLGMNTSTELRSGGYLHWTKYKARGERMPVAVVVGVPPAVGYASIQKAPENLDELALAGGLVGCPINVVRAKTVDLLVPAEAEIVIEGYVDTEYLEPEAPFGESHGHVNMQEYNAFMEVTCITMRRKPVLTSFMAQLAPSEVSVMRRPGQEFIFLNHFRNVLGIKGITRVYSHEPLTGGYKTFVLQFERGVPDSEVWRALYAATTVQRASGKIVIAINDDLDPTNSDALLWAIAFRSKPHLDVQVLPHRGEGHGPRDKTRGSEDSSLLINATLRQDFPPIALPKQEFMERAKEIWENELGQPKLHPQAPWFGYSLGAWTDELEKQAQLATESDYWQTGEDFAQRRRNDVEMNTEVRDVEGIPPGAKKS